MLRRPSDEEIAQIIANMVTQAKSNYNLINRVVGDPNHKPTSIFIKKLEKDVKQSQDKQKAVEIVN